MLSRIPLLPRDDTSFYFKLFHSRVRSQFDFVVKTFGGCTTRPNICIVAERASHSLFDLLHHRGDFSSPCPAPSEALSSREKAAMLYDVARGLQVHHQEGYAGIVTSVDSVPVPCGMLCFHALTSFPRPFRGTLLCQLRTAQGGF